MSYLIIEKNDENAASLASCEVGKQETFTIVGTPVVTDDGHVIATIESAAAEYVEPAEEEETPAEPAETPYRPKAKSGSALAVE